MFGNNFFYKKGDRLSLEKTHVRFRSFPAISAAVEVSISVLHSRFIVPPVRTLHHILFFVLFKNFIFSE